MNEDGIFNRMKTAILKKDVLLLLLGVFVFIYVVAVLWTGIYTQKNVASMRKDVQQKVALAVNGNIRDLEIYIDNRFSYITNEELDSLVSVDINSEYNKTLKYLFYNHDVILPDETKIYIDSNNRNYENIWIPEHSEGRSSIVQYGNKLYLHYNLVLKNKKIKALSFDVPLDYIFNKINSSLQITASVVVNKKFFHEMQSPAVLQLKSDWMLLKNNYNAFAQNGSFEFFKVKVVRLNGSYFNSYYVQIFSSDINYPVYILALQNVDILIKEYINLVITLTIVVLLIICITLVFLSFSYNAFIHKITLLNNSIEQATESSVLICRENDSYREMNKDLLFKNKHLRILIESNKLIINATDDAELFSGICNILTHYGDYSWSFISLLEDDFKITGYSGIDYENIDKIENYYHRESDNSIIKTVFDQNKVIYYEKNDGGGADYWLPQLTPDNGKVMFIPLLVNQKVIGVMSICFLSKNMFSGNDIVLIMELTEYVVFGIAVTRSKKAQMLFEKLLRTEQLKYQLLFNSSNSAIFITSEAQSAEGLIMEVNDVACDLLGYTRNEYKSLSFKVLAVEKYQEQLIHILKLNDQNLHELYQFELLHKNGEAIIVELGVKKIFFDNQFVNYIFIRDIRDRIAAQKEINYTRDLAKLYYDLADVIILGLDINYNITMINKKGSRLLLRTENDIVGLNWINEFILPEERNRMVSCYEDMKNSKVTANYIQSHVSVKDNPIVEWHNCSIYDDQNNVSGIIISGLDITERYKLEQERIKLETIISHSPAIGIIFSFKEGWPIDFISTNIIQYGYSADDFYKKKITIKEILEEEDFLRCEDAIRKCVESGEECYKFTCKSKKNVLNKQENWFDVRLKFIYNNKTPVYLYSVIIEITDEKILQKELENLNNLLKEKNRELEKIIYITSHDFRTPMVNIQGWANQLMSDVNDLISELDQESITDNMSNIRDERIPMAVNYISISIKKMDSLLKSMLELSRAGRVDLKVELLDMNSILSDVISIHKFELEKYNFTVTVENLPPVSGDKQKLNEVISNILSNSIKYRNSSVSPEIKITSYKSDKYNVYKFSDNGIGIPSTRLTDIFDIFVRINNEIPGDGMGLAIAKKIIERHDGKIWVESVINSGSTFFIALPDAGKYD